MHRSLQYVYTNTRSVPPSFIEGYIHRSWIGTSTTWEETLRSYLAGNTYCSSRTCSHWLYYSHEYDIFFIGSR